MPIAPRMRRTLTAAAVVHVGAAVLGAPTLAGGDRAAVPVEPVGVSLGTAAASGPVGMALGATPSTTSTSTPASSTSTSTSTTAASTTATGPVEAPDSSGSVRTVESTAYCLDGTTASGAEVGPGQAAMNGVPLGTRVTILTGPLAGSTLVVTDRIGWGTELDVWFDDCDAARDYGRVVVDVVLG